MSSLGLAKTRPLPKPAREDPAHGVENIPVAEIIIRLGSRAYIYT